MNAADYKTAARLPPSLNRNNMYEVAETFDSIMAQVNALTELVCLYPCIDSLSSDFIDELAVQFHLEYYDKSLPLEQRRELVKNGIPWHMIKGTAGVVNEAIQVITRNAKIKEWFEYGGQPYYFRIEINGETITKAEHDAIRKLALALKNVRSWLECVVWYPGKQMILNSGGVLVTREVAAVTKELIIHSTLFDTGLNDSGKVEHFEETTSKTTTIKRLLFTGPKLNGRMRLNGDFADREERDLGGYVTDTWETFAGGRLNGDIFFNGLVGANDIEKKTLSQRRYVPDVRTVIIWHGNVLNGSAVKIKTESNTVTETKHRQRFIMPGFALNQIGKPTESWEDVGEDVTVTRTVFHDGLNGAAMQSKETTIETPYTKRITTFDDGLNGDEGLNGDLKLNDLKTTTRTESGSTTKTTVAKLFNGLTLGGRLGLNRVASTTKQETVHIEKWRKVKRYHGASVLNNNNRHTETTTKTVIIKPAHTEKYFSYERGTLLNDKAVLGYLRLS